MVHQKVEVHLCSPPPPRNVFIQADCGKGSPEPILLDNATSIEALLFKTCQGFQQQHPPHID